jgi:Asp-tRNA(Asn)/Glu-tRNA(Gln) amidotransferase A subunit family amidase
MTPLRAGLERLTLSDDLTKKSATQLVALIRARAVSPVEIVAAHLRRIERLNPSLNAIVTVADDVLDRARDAEAELLRGTQVGPLHGLPLTIKDTIDTKGLRTTSGSRLLAKRVPDRDATAVARLKTAGAIILGKTNTPEMAIPYETDNPVFGRTNNPHDLKRTPGGSSGGEAAAIAACLSPVGVGSDLSGSIRVPAHFCGIAGLKPTSGLVPMDGHLPSVTGSLTLGACIGPMARSVEDLWLILNVLAPSSRSSVGGELAAIGMRGCRLAYYPDDGVVPVTKDTRQAIEKAARALADAGVEVEGDTPPALAEGSRLWVELFSQVSIDQLRQTYRGREDEAGPKVSQFLAQAVEASAELADKIEVVERRARAIVERTHLRERLLRWMKKTPLILAPVGSVPAFEHGAQRVTVERESISVFRAFSYSQTFNVFGLPSAVVPVGQSAEGLPIGVQIVGRPLAEQSVLAAASVIEEALGGG